MAVWSGRMSHSAVMGVKMGNVNPVYPIVQIRNAEMMDVVGVVVIAGPLHPMSVRGIYFMNISRMGHAIQTSGVNIPIKRRPVSTDAVMASATIVSPPVLVRIVGLMGAVDPVDSVVLLSSVI
jgi:hypothetical protein